MKAYLFVDAENHFLRATKVAEEIIGSPLAAQAMSGAKIRVPGIRGYPDHIDGKRFGWDPDLQLFWDCELLSRGGLLSDLRAEVARAIYVASCTGDDDRAHEMRVRLRGFGFEPIVIREQKDLRKQRDRRRKEHCMIEKPKGCDIAIATRMVADAAADLYDCCFLFTSDADFLPAVEAVRQMGKVVWVFGFASALAARSPYFYIPDRFVDLRRHLNNAWRNHHHPIKWVLGSLGATGPFNDPD